MQTRTDFIKGMDLSLLGHLQSHGVQYRDAAGVKDPLLIFREHGVNCVRLRLFVHPDGTNGQVNTLPYTLALAKRVHKAGLRWLLDFHYSDEWADPLHQTIPALWAGLSHSELAERVFSYTRATLTAFAQEGCLPDMVQVGNEITNGMLWPAAGPLSEASSWNDIHSRMPWPEGSPEILWDALAEFVQAGIQGVRAADPDGAIPVMLHADKGGNWQVCRRFFDAFVSRAVSFDVIGLSYYPFWHGTLEDFKDNLAFLSDAYGKDIVVVETGYDWNGGEQGALPFPLTPLGQRAFLEEVIKVVANAPGGRGRGVFYWAPEWIQGQKWQGPDWSPIWEHRALFDTAGTMLPGLEAFR